MSDWSKRYEQLPAAERKEVDDQADRQFRQLTRVSRPLDPKRDHALMVQWLRIRDDVMAQMAGRSGPDWRKTGKGLVLYDASFMRNQALLVLYNYDIQSDKPKEQHLKALDGVFRPLLLAKLDLTVAVIGHASRTGGTIFDNQSLSSRRAIEVDKYLRKLGGHSIKFFKAGGTGSKDEVSKEPAYRDAWPKLESLDEDERDRSVVLLIQWVAPGAIDALNTPNIDWKKAFDQAASRAGLMYALTMGTAIVSDYLSPFKDIPYARYSPWNPWTGWPTSWTTGNPDADAVMQAMGKMMIDEIEQRARNMNLNISRDEIIQHYQDWLKDPANKWVNP